MRTVFRMIVMLAIVAAIFAGLNWFVNFRTNIIKNVMAGLADPPQTVATGKATKQPWQRTVAAVGTFRAVNGSDLAVEVAGIIDKINFTSGDDVKAGQELLDLRRDEDIAKLNALQATAEGAAITLKRDQSQLALHAVSQAVVDNDTVALKSALANVAQQQALIDQKTLRAPFDGRLGIRNVDVGQYMSPGTAIVTLQALDKLFLDFTLPQQAVADIKVGQSIIAHVDAFPTVEFKGTIAALNAKVDQASRNVTIRATFDNADHRLLPGMYASVAIDVGTPQTYITLPQTAVITNPYGNAVYLAVKPENATSDDALVAKQTFIKTGETRGDQIAVLSGVDEGATVVTAGQIKLRNGSKLKVNNAIETPNDPNPKPVDQ
jgi:membrane fusion protein (multidrug efflux system)